MKNKKRWSREIETILTFFEKYEIPVLAGNITVVEVRDQQFVLGGVDDPDAAKYTDPEVPFDDQLAAVASAMEREDLYKVLLSHRPELVEEYEKYEFDLVLSGHAHGGQWRLPGVLNGLFAPNQGLFPAHAGGRYSLESGAEMIVSRGLARETTWVPRIFNRPELVMIELQ